MSRGASLAVRAAAVASCGGLMASGLFFALRGEGSPGALSDSGPGAEPTEQQIPTGPAARLMSPSVETQGPSMAASNPPAADDSTNAPSAQAPPATSAPMTAAQPRAPTAVPTTAPLSSSVITDLPKYKDTAVLALAAGAILPSGRTFQECLEMPPSHDRWPTPVHLYYEGNGFWLVETHVSEVQVRFNEATGTFTSLNFRPPNGACRTSP